MSQVGLTPQVTWCEMSVRSEEAQEAGLLSTYRFLY